MVAEETDTRAYTANKVAEARGVTHPFRAVPTGRKSDPSGSIVQKKHVCVAGGAEPLDLVAGVVTLCVAVQAFALVVGRAETAAEASHMQHITIVAQVEPARISYLKQSRAGSPLAVRRANGSPRDCP